MTDMAAAVREHTEKTDRMVRVGNLMNTSAHDAKITLEGMLASRPAEAARTALDLLEALQGKEGQASRRKAAASVLRKAAKAMEVER